MSTDVAMAVVDVLLNIGGFEFTRHILSQDGATLTEILAAVAVDRAGGGAFCDPRWPDGELFRQTEEGRQILVADYATDREDDFGEVPEIVTVTVVYDDGTEEEVSLPEAVANPSAGVETSPNPQPD